MSKNDKDLDYEIFKELKESNNYLSGQNLANKFRISRQGLWKHIKNLTDCGYKIEAVPRLGYKIKNSPDKLYPWELRYNLNTKFIGKNIYFKDFLNSTQEFIFKLAQSGSPAGTVVVAERQKKGKGRMGRAWASPKGGVYLSCLLRPKSILLKDVSQISLVIALACIEAIKKETGIALSVKWPNDIFLGNKKLGGILCEISAEADKVNFVVVGIGLNINSTVLPKEAVSLRLHTNKSFSKVSLTKEIFRQIEAYYLELERGNGKKLLKEWQKYCFLWGSRIRVKVLDRTIEGEAAGIDQRGYLLVRQDTGLIDKVSSGDVIKIM
ncbi:MAG: biotin--[acetyl-CoA-carboxylase] ligase [Candidatus Omnitrophota bacterium]